MEEFKGTKGEWMVNENAIICNKITIAVTLLKNFALNTDGTMSKDKEMEANAKLIAAAPTLLYRLNSLILSVKAHPDYVFGEDGDEWHDLISLSEEAINKALK